MAVDYEVEGLLEGCSEEERAARVRLLDRLLESGYEVGDLRAALAENRLAVLPLERVMMGGRRYTLAQTSERLDLDIDFLMRNHLAIGLPRPGPDDPVYDDDDLERLTMAKQIHAAGIDIDRWLAMTRVTGQSTARIAEALFEQFADAFVQPGDSRDELALRFADIAESMLPFLGPMVAGPTKFHMQEMVRRRAIDAFERTSGALPGASDVAVGFADLVGFTSLTESMDLDEVGDVTGRLESLAGDVCEAPVRLVKTIGDAAMLAAPDAAGLTGAALDLMDAVAAEARLPELRAGLAFGPALQRAGDVYGQPVNLASRLTDVAEPGGVLAAETFATHAGDGFRSTPAGEVKLKGFEQPVRVVRVERA